MIKLSRGRSNYSGYRGSKLRNGENRKIISTGSMSNDPPPNKICPEGTENLSQIRSIFGKKYSNLSTTHLGSKRDSVIRLPPDYSSSYSPYDRIQLYSKIRYKGNKT